MCVCVEWALVLVFGGVHVVTVDIMLTSSQSSLLVSQSGFFFLGFWCRATYSCLLWMCYFCISILRQHCAAGCIHPQQTYLTPHPSGWGDDLIFLINLHFLALSTFQISTKPLLMWAKISNRQTYLDSKKMLMRELEVRSSWSPWVCLELLGVGGASCVPWPHLHLSKKKKKKKNLVCLLVPVLSFSISLWVCPTWQASFSLCSTVTVLMANWFRLCENRHKDRHRQLRIAQGPLPPHPSPLLSLPPVRLCPPLPPHTPLLRVEEASFIPPFCPLFLLGCLLSYFRPSWVPLLPVVSMWTVAVGGWKIALSERARAGPTCSARSDTDSECSYLWSQSTITDWSLKRPPWLLLVFHACTWFCHFVKLKDIFMYLKRLECRCAEANGSAASLSTCGPGIIEFPPNTHMLKKKKKLCLK